jgi:glycerophosphoryl diester phosphodiesterase
MQLDFLPQVIGHRGAKAYAPENTLAAFNQALSLGCRFIEMDVMCSHDGEPFVIHDNSLNRTTNGKGDVGLVSSEYIQPLDAGSWFSRRFLGEKIPHFREALQWLAFSGIQANIEIKPYPGTTEQTTVTILRYLNRYWPTDKPLPLISSFDWQALDLCQAISPEMPLGLLMDTWRENWFIEAGDRHCYSIHLNKRILTEERAKNIKEQGYKLCVYTVNRKRQAKKLLALGVDAVFSDYPDLLG